MVLQNVHIKVIFFFIVFSYPCSSIIHAQEFYQSGDLLFEHFQRKDGLPDNSVLSMIQDSRGFLWMGTFNGLARYDGYEFTDYKQDLNNPNGLRGNDIYTLLEDRDGFIWAGTWGGVNRYDPETREFTYFQCFDKNSYVKGLDFKNHSIGQDSTGAIWVGSGYGLSRIEQEGEVRIQMIRESSYPSNLMKIADSIASAGHPLASILKAGTNENKIRTFNLTKRQHILVMSTGEIGPGFYDYGWLENKAGEILWKISDSPTFHAGGSLDNRVNYAILNLRKGEYDLHFKSDYGHNYGSWSRSPPLKPESWGIQAFLLDANKVPGIISVLEKYKSRLNDPGGFIGAIHTDKKGRTWLGTNKGLSQVDLERNKDLDQDLQFINYFHHPADSNSLGAITITAICESKNGLWIAGVNLDSSANPVSTLNLFNPETKEFTSRHLPFMPNISVKNMIEDSLGNLWLGTNGIGVFMFPRATEHLIQNRLTFSHYTLSPLHKDATFDNEIFSICADHSGNYWFGTAFDGLFKLNPQSSSFAFHELPKEGKQLDNSIFINDIIEDRQGNYWIGTLVNGLIVLDETGHLITEYNVKFKHLELYKSPIYELFEDSHGWIWIGTKNNGLYGYIPERETFFQNKNRVSHIIEDQFGDLWMASGSGIIYFDRSKKLFTSTVSVVADPTSLSGNSVNCLLQDSEETIWAGCGGTGLNKMLIDSADNDSADIQFEHFLPNMVVRSLHEDQKGRLWVGTNASGLLLFDKKTGNHKSFTVKDGLVNNQVESIFEDTFGQLWVFTPGGISKFNPDSLLFINFDINDGLHFIEKTDVPRASINHKGALLTGGENGFFQFHPDSIPANSIAPLCVINRIEYYKKDKISKENLIFSKNNNHALALKHFNHNLTIDYIGLEYDRPANINYKYRMLGLDDHWVEVGNERKARYSQLPHGKYTFEVKAMGRNGLWSKVPASLSITIFPPWWFSWWAYVLYSIIAGCLFFSWRKYDQKRINLQHIIDMRNFEKQKLQELVQLKSRFYTSISHEFRTPITIIMGMADQIIRQPKRNLKVASELIKRNGAQVLTLINQLLDLSQLESDSMQFHFIYGDILTYMRYLLESFRSFAAAKRINVRFESGNTSIMMDYDPEVIQKIVSNLMSNAVKFGRNYGDILLSVNKVYKDNDPELLITLQDNGAGIPQEDLKFIFDRYYRVNSVVTRASEGTGIGLSLVKELVENLGGTIEVQSVLSKGTLFSIWLPIHNRSQYATQSDKPENHENVISSNEEMALLLEGSSQINQLQNFQEVNNNLNTLLLVEDNSDVVEYLAIILEGEYYIEVATNGRHGIDKAIELIPDLIISDVMMPEVDGFTLCETLKTDERTSHIPIIILTAKATFEDRIRGLKRGADAYLSKPFIQQELMVRIEQLLESRIKEQKYYSSHLPELRSGKEHNLIENKFLQKVKAIIEQNLDVEDFNHTHLEKNLHLSRTQLYRKVKALTGRSISLYIRLIRLQKAKHLLQTEDLNITEVAYKVGFKSLSHFSRYFSEEFGMSPSAFIK